MAMDKEKSSSYKLKQYGKIVISLDNIMLTDEKLLMTPSNIDGLQKIHETDLRMLGCELIQTAGILLKLPQVAMATGQVLLQRFYYCKSFVNHPVEIYAMGCVCLASKIEEAPRRVRDVINVFHHMKQVRTGKDITPVILDQNYVNLKNQVIKAERKVLKELGFCVHVKHPHKIIVMYLQVLECEKNTRLMQCAWNYMNDALRTDVFLKFHPETVACACIYLAARILKLPLPKRPYWFEVFGAKERDIQELCVTILNLYQRPKPDQEELEKIIDDLRKSQHEAKLKAKGKSGMVTPLQQINFSPNSQSTTPKQSPNMSKKNHRDKDQRHSSTPDEASNRDNVPNNHSPSARKSQRRERRSSSRSKYNDIDYSNHKEKKHRKRKRRSRSVSLSLSPPPEKSKKYREKRKSRAHSRSRSQDRGYSSCHDKYDKDYSKYGKSSKNHKSKSEKSRRRSRSREAKR